MQDLRPVTAEADVTAVPTRSWSLLDRLEKTAVATAGPDGSVRVRCADPAGCFLFGPYLHLPEGRYRLSFACQSGPAAMTAQPVLGVEIIVLSRFLRRWADFTAAELADGSGSVEFDVPPEHSLEGENEGRFEFRFFHLGNADLRIAAVELNPLSGGGDGGGAANRWRLLGRLNKSWLGRRDAAGSVKISRLEPPGRVLYGGWPYLRLPRGAYRLTVGARAARANGGAVLGLEIWGQSRWLSSRQALRIARLPETTGVQMASRDFTAAELAADRAAVEFVVPTEMSLEAGADAPFDIRLYHRGKAGLAIDAVELRSIPAVSLAPPNRVALRPAGRRKIVIIGNCQSETLRQGFAQIEALNRRFEVRYHFVQLPKNLHEFAARDLETCDILMIQDIRLWDEFPLRDAVRPGADQVRFPLVRFASPWPFDAWNGPGDTEAHNREAPNLTFPYLDGLLGRLRREISDPEERFRAYRALDFAGIVNYRRLHELELRRLAGMDKKFNFSIGAFIAENFQSRRVFHTTVRPNWEVFNLLMQFVARAVGATDPVALTEAVDTTLRNPQVPVHPKVAADLGMAWIDDNTRYFNRGVALSWEQYVRQYIAHYG